MPRFYFDQPDYRDRAGAELSDDTAARCYAMRLAGEIIRDMAPEERSFYWRMDVREGSRRSVFSLVFETLAARAPLAEGCSEPAEGAEWPQGGRQLYG